MVTIVVLLLAPLTGGANNAPPPRCGDGALLWTYRNQLVSIFRRTYWRMPPWR
jgi:hypothetical protein